MKPFHYSSYSITMGISINTIYKTCIYSLHRKYMCKISGMMWRDIFCAHKPDSVMLGHLYVCSKIVAMLRVGMGIEVFELR